MKTYTYENYTINLEKICYMKKTTDYFAEQSIILTIVFSSNVWIKLDLGTEEERDKLYNDIKRAMQEC